MKVQNNLAAVMQLDLLKYKTMQPQKGLLLKVQNDVTTVRSTYESTN